MAAAAAHAKAAAMHVVRATPELLTLFRERRIFHRLGSGERWKAGDRLGLLPGCRLEPYSNITMGPYIPAAIGAFSYSHSDLRPALHIGRYASIGENVRFMGDRHPIEWVSSSPFSYDLFALQGSRAFYEDHDPAGLESRRTYPQPPADIHVGNDVWIGDEAMIARGVTIGDGAVIASRALVLEDVPPYALVMGTPAQVRRLRFAEPLVERLLASRWWRYAPSILDRLPLEEPERFLDAFEALVARDPPAPLDLQPVTYEEIVAAAPVVAAQP
jgi:acetyltransferase-like isoleucine patch superfamily enzyme